MVRRLSLALLALLAVALPASAEDAATPEQPPEGASWDPVDVLEAECPWFDPACAPRAEAALEPVHLSETYDDATDEGDCALFEFNWGNLAHPFSLDPTGCWQRLIRGTLDRLPPAESAFDVASELI